MPNSITSLPAVLPQNHQNTSFNSFQTLPNEIYLHLCNYLNLKDIEALSKSASKLRSTFNSHAWSHCTVLPDNATSNTIPCNYVYCNSRPITVHMLLHPKKFNWFHPSRVKHLYITWEALTDIAQYSSILLNNHSPFLISRFPNIQTIKLSDRHYNDNDDDQPLDFFYSLGGQMLAADTDFSSFGHLTCIELLRLFHSAPVIDYFFSSVPLVRSISSESNVRSLSLVVSSLSQSENLLSNLRDPYFFEKLRCFRNLQTFALHDNSPQLDHISITYPIAQIVRSLNTLPKLAHISIHQPRYSVASLSAMNLLNGNYQKCELALSLLLDQLDESNLFNSDPSQLFTFNDGALVHLLTVTHINFKHGLLHQMCPSSTNISHNHILSRLICPNLKSIKGIEIPPDAIPPAVFFESVTSLDALLLSNSVTRATGPISVATHIRDVISRFPNVKTLKLRTQLHSHTNHSFIDPASNSNEWKERQSYNNIAVIFKILSDTFTYELGDLYESFIRKKTLAGFYFKQIHNIHSLQNQIEEKFIKLISFCKYTSEQWTIQDTQNENNPLISLKEWFHSIDPCVSNLSSNLTAIAKLYLQTILECDEICYATENSHQQTGLAVSFDSHTQTGSNCKVRLSEILKAEDNFNNGIPNLDNSYAKRFDTNSNNNLPVYLVRLILAIPILESFSPQICQLLNSFQNSFGVVKLLQQSILAECLQVEYLQLDDYSFDLFHPHTIPFLKQHKNLKQMLFYSPRNCVAEVAEGNCDQPDTVNTCPVSSLPHLDQKELPNITLDKVLRINCHQDAIASPPLYKYGPLYPYLYDIIMNRCASNEPLEHPHISTVLMVDQFHRKCASRRELLRSVSKKDISSLYSGQLSNEATDCTSLRSSSSVDHSSSVTPMSCLGTASPHHASSSLHVYGSMDIDQKPVAATPPSPAHKSHFTDPSLIETYCPDLIPDVLSRTSHQNIVWPVAPNRKKLMNQVHNHGNEHEMYTTTTPQSSSSSSSSTSLSSMRSASHSPHTSLSQTTLSSLLKPWDMAPSVTFDLEYVDCKVTQNIAPWFGESDFDGWI